MTQSDTPEPPRPAAPPYPYGAYPGGYPPPPPQPYADYTPPPAGPKNALGVGALVVAIIGLVATFTVIGGVVLGIAAVIMGFIARGRVKRGEATNGGMAIAGVILGALAIVVALVFIPIYFGLANEAGFSDYVSCMEGAGTDSAAQAKCQSEFQDNLEDKLGVPSTAPTP